MKKKTVKFTPEEQSSYNELVANIRKELDEAYVKGVDFNREHFLNCYACECFEGMSKKGARGVYHKDGSPARGEVRQRRPKAASAGGRPTVTSAACAAPNKGSATSMSSRKTAGGSDVKINASVRHFHYIPGFPVKVPPGM